MWISAIGCPHMIVPLTHIIRQVPYLVFARHGDWQQKLAWVTTHEQIGRLVLLCD